MGLNIMLSNGQSMSLLLPEHEAKAIVDGWRQKTLKDLIGGNTVDGVDWAVRSESIIAVHTFPLERLQQQVPQQAAAGPLRLGGSGLPMWR